MELSKYVLLARLAAKWVGLTEQGGDNHGQVVEWFQKQAGGPAQGEAWCCAFARSLVDWVDALGQEAVPTALAKTESVLALWNGAPPQAKSQTPQTGWLACWEHRPGGTPSGKGHIGIVTGMMQQPPGQFWTVEGNTGPGAGVERNGDGIYRKERHLGAAGEMVLLGFVNPWWRAEPS